METAITEDLQYCDPVLGTRRSIEDLSTRALKKAELKIGSGDCKRAERSDYRVKSLVCGK